LKGKQKTAASMTPFKLQTMLDHQFIDYLAHLLHIAVVEYGMDITVGKNKAFMSL
jgi:predicted membrane channel-forming protein YqfA (hemolysin III family)